MEKVYQEYDIVNSQVFGDIPAVPISSEEIDDLRRYLERSVQYLTNVRTLSVGQGSRVFRVDSDGIWMGSEEFNDANFSVDMEGNALFRSSATGARIELSTSDIRLLVHDGNTNRIVIGKV